MEDTNQLWELETKFRELDPYRDLRADFLTPIGKSKLWEAELKGSRSLRLKFQGLARRACTVLHGIGFPPDYSQARLDFLTAGLSTAGREVEIWLHLLQVRGIGFRIEGRHEGFLLGRIDNVCEASAELLSLIGAELHNLPSGTGEPHPAALAELRTTAEPIDTTLTRKARLELHRARFEPKPTKHEFAEASFPNKKPRSAYDSLKKWMQNVVSDSASSAQEIEKQIASGLHPTQYYVKRRKAH